MTPELEAIVVALGSIFGGALAAWISSRRNAKKIKADAAHIIEETSGNLIERMERRLVAVENELRDTRKQLSEALKKNETLESRVKTLEEITIIKDNKIAELIREGLEKDAKIAALEGRVAELESELLKLRLK